MIPTGPEVVEMAVPQSQDLTRIRISLTVLRARIPEEAVDFYLAPMEL